VKRFPRYEFLYELSESLQSGRNLHVLKSRQMIATTTICAYFLWSLLFRDGWSGLMTSRKDTLVDDGGSRASWNSLFGRVLFMWQNLPEWMRIDLQVSANKIACPFRSSYIIGESANIPDVGRGGTYSTALMDEAAKIPRSEAAFSSINDAARQIIMNSTPAGKQGVFYRIHMSPSADYVKMRMHWSRHPHRNTAWYEQECKNRTAEDIAEELDCSFAKSVRGRCIPEFDYERNVSASVLYSPYVPVYAGWDFGIGDPTAVVFRQEQRGIHCIIASIQRPDLTVKDFAPLAEAVIRKAGYVGDIGDIYCVGDSEGGKRDRQTGLTDIRAYRQFGWNIQGVRCHERERVRRWRLLCKEGQLLIHPNNGELIECLQQLHYPRTPDGDVVSMDHSDPRGHEYSHLPDAGGYDLFKNVRIGEVAEPALLAGV
jgi:hypothetical protein